MGAQEKVSALSNSMQRVKVYRLNGDGKWDDQGTGHVTVDYLERSEEPGLFVIDEEDNETLLFHRICADDIYRKQEDTIISWNDPEYSTELALSFQETTGCSYIWDHISNVQRNMHFDTLNNESYTTVNSELRELPTVELSTLPLVLKIVVESGISDQMRMTDLILQDQDFFRKLMDAFRICEDLDNNDGLHMIFKIVKGIILLNSPQIFDKLFADELIMDVIGSLEYDPDSSHVQRHRAYLKDHAIFKEAIPIKDPAVLSKIHLSHRVGFLKDVILPRVLDDATVASLSSLIHSNNAMVVSLLKDDNTFIQELFSRLRSSTTSAESKEDLVLFLHEFCSLSKSLQMVQQHRLFRDLVGEGIFDIIADVLRGEDKKLMLIGTDILLLFINQDPSLLRSYVTQQEGSPLLGLLIKGMITDFEDDMHCQFLEIVRSLLDSYASGPQRDSIIDFFYEKHFGELVEVLTSSCPVNGSDSKSAVCNGCPNNQIRTKPEILLSICELLCFCVLHHPYRIKCNFLLNNVIDKILCLIRRREKYLAVAAVRFMRTLISQKDEHLMNHIMKNNLLKPVVETFVRNGDRDNLLNSAILELFEYIWKEGLKMLLKYLVSSFWDQLVKFENLASIQSLKIKYEQSLEEVDANNSVNALESRRRMDERALEKEEEDYFNEDSDEEDSSSGSTTRSPSVQSQSASSNGSTPGQPAIGMRSGGLVDYEDDEDDEDYKPPRKQSDISEEDQGIVQSFTLKRKLDTKEEPERTKKQRIGKNTKSKEGMFAALCSTLSQAVLPNKKPAINVGSNDSNTYINEENLPAKGSISCFSNFNGLDDEKEDKESIGLKSCSDSLHNVSENGQASGEDILLISPNSSEMAVNGS